MISGKAHIKLGVLIFLALSCNHNSVPQTAESGFISHLVFSKLNSSITNKLKQITDSGTLNGELLNVNDTLKIIFSETSFARKWLKDLLNKSLFKLLNEKIKYVETHGLNPEYYHYHFLKNGLNQIQGKVWANGTKVNYDSLAMIVIFSADAYLGLYHDMCCGRVDPAYTGSVDKLPRRVCSDLPGLIRSDTLAKAINNCIPRFKAYAELQKEYLKVLKYPEAVLNYQTQFNEAWLKDEQPYPQQVLAILKKLRALGYGSWSEKLINRIEFNSPLFNNALSNFKIEHNLPNPLVLDKETVDRLNITKPVMLVRVKANLERWRWLGPATEPSRIWVNIAENIVYAWRNDSLKVKMNVCSGQNRDEAYYRRLKLSAERNSKILPPDNLETPLLKATLTHFVVNPTWYVPRNIAVKEILPVIKANPGSLARYDYILRNSDGDEIDPYSVDWTEMNTHHFPFSIEQHSGSQNSLGKVVIHFPNGFNIYMHDTPAKGVFGWDERHVSHGCVRLEHPFDMIEYVCSFGKKDNYDKVLMSAGMPPEHDKELLKKYKIAKKDSASFEKYKEKENEYYMADEKLPVYIVYFTCFMNDLGKIEYTNDAYKRDEKMMRVMGRPGKKSTK